MPFTAAAPLVVLFDTPTTPETWPLVAFAFPPTPAAKFVVLVVDPKTPNTCPVFELS
jgi:hypothetical protein